MLESVKCIEHLTERILPGCSEGRRGSPAKSGDAASAYAEMTHLMVESLGALRDLAEDLGKGREDGVGDG